MVRPPRLVAALLALAVLPAVGPGEEPLPSAGARDDTPGPGPQPAPGRVLEDRPAPQAGGTDGGSGLDAQIRELEGALWREIAALESRLGALRARLEGHLGSGRDAPSRPQQGSPTVLPGVDQDRHEGLLRHQEELVLRWRTLLAGPPGSGLSRPGVGGLPPSDPGRARREGSDGTREPRASDSRGAELRRVREELRGVLLEILDLREAARAREIDRLRARLEELERDVQRRHAPEERRALVEARLRELLPEEERFGAR
ncbi:MAG: hypothetical protein HY721_32315 [Planctomycetes bacterium]|nr:hypothetical protein [Planctomycetota bacterium]